MSIVCAIGLAVLVIGLLRALCYLRSTQDARDWSGQFTGYRASTTSGLGGGGQ